MNYCSNCGDYLGSLGGNYCPSCGASLASGASSAKTLALRGPASGSLVPAFQGDGQWRRYSTLESSVPWALPEGGDGVNLNAWRRSPARSPEFMGDVVVPAGQAALIGLATGILAFPLPWIIQGLPWWSFGPVGLGSFAIATYALIRSNRAHLWNEEHISQEAPESSDPIVEVANLNVSHFDEDGRFIQGLNLTLPGGVTRAKFYDFAKKVIQPGTSLAVTDWTGKGKPFSKAKYNLLLDALQEAGIIEWADEDNHSVGRRLPGHGRRALLKFCAEYEANK